MLAEHNLTGRRMPLAFPETETASFFSTTVAGRRAPFNFVDLFMPSNPFYSLANNIVQATMVVPEPEIVKIPLAYPLARRDLEWAHFINTWIDFKRRDGTIDALCDHWVLGKQAVARKPRWSIMRNVLHWAD